MEYRNLNKKLKNEKVIINKLNDKINRRKNDLFHDLLNKRLTSEIVLKKNNKNNIYEIYPENLNLPLKLQNFNLKDESDPISFFNDLLNSKDINQVKFALYLIYNYINLNPIENSKKIYESNFVDIFYNYLNLFIDENQICIKILQIMILLTEYVQNYDLFFFLTEKNSLSLYILLNNKNLVEIVELLVMLIYNICLFESFFQLKILFYDYFYKCIIKNIENFNYEILEFLDEKCKNICYFSIRIICIECKMLKKINFNKLYNQNLDDLEFLNILNIDKHQFKEIINYLNLIIPKVIMNSYNFLIDKIERFGLKENDIEIMNHLILGINNLSLIKNKAIYDIIFKNKKILKLLYLSIFKNHPFNLIQIIGNFLCYIYENDNLFLDIVENEKIFLFLYDNLIKYKECKNENDSIYLKYILFALSNFQYMGDEKLLELIYENNLIKIYLSILEQINDIKIINDAIFCLSNYITCENENFANRIKKNDIKIERFFKVILDNLEKYFNKAVFLQPLLESLYYLLNYNEEIFINNFINLGGKEKIENLISKIEDNNIINLLDKINEKINNKF